MWRIIPAKRNCLNGGSKCYCGRASRHEFQKRCSDQHRSSTAVHQRRVFALDEDLLAGCFPALHQDVETETCSMAARRECRSARIRPMPTAVLTRATHERALIGHREPDSGRSHGFFRTIDGEIAIEALMADPHAAPGPPAHDLPPAAPHRRLARMPMLMGAPVIVPSMNSISHRCESGSAIAPSAVFPRPGTSRGGNGDALCQHPATGP